MKLINPLPSEVDAACVPCPRCGGDGDEKPEKLRQNCDQCLGYGRVLKDYGVPPLRDERGDIDPDQIAFELQSS